MCMSNDFTAHSSGLLYARSAFAGSGVSDINSKRIITLVLHSDMEFDEVLDLLRERDAKTALPVLAARSKIIHASAARDMAAVESALDHESILSNVEHTRRMGASPFC
jgi:hypothetical protein